MPDGKATNTIKYITFDLFGLFIISLATLLYEINLTRLYSVSQYYHFAFLIIGFAMFGFGASGTCFALFPHLSNRTPRQWMAGFCLGFSLSCACGFILMNTVPFDSFSIAWDWRQSVILVIHSLVLSLPFFCSGAVLNICFAQHAQIIGPVYAINLIGSACGCVVAMIVPQWIGGDGIIWLSTILGVITAFIFYINSTMQRNASMLVAISLVGVIATIVMIHKPSELALQLSPYKGLSYIQQYPDFVNVSERWNGYSRVDVVSSSALRSLPGLSYTYYGQLPPQSAVLIDGDNPSAILEIDTLDTSLLEFAHYLPSAIAYYLKPGAHTMVLEPHGGLEVWAALALGSTPIMVVESNPLIIDAAPELYQRPDVEVIIEDARSIVQRHEGMFDIISLPLNSPYHPIRSGAYSLAEDYHQTLQAYRDYIKCLKSDGILVITKWLQTPPSESLRVFTTAVTALEHMHLEPAAHIVAFRGYNTMTFLINHAPFTLEALQTIRAFTHERAYDLVFAPDIDPAEVNIHNVLPDPIYYDSFTAFLNTENRTIWYKTYPFDVRPTTDTRPFFGHYFKVSQIQQIIDEFGTSWQPFGGAGFMVIIIFLSLSIGAATVLVLIPLVFTHKQPLQTHSIKCKGIHTYGLLGLGYLLIEIPLTQKYILYLGHPAYAMTVVLFSLLIASGIGSMIAHKGQLRKSLLLVVGLGIVTMWGFDIIFQATMKYPLYIRVITTGGLLFPLGMMMGLPFSQGIRAYKLTGPRCIAYAWSVNGASSVIASVLAAYLALVIGLHTVYIAGLCCYGLAWLTTVRVDQ